MTVKLVRAILGSRDYLVPTESSQKAAGLLMNSGANYRSMRMRDGALTFTLEMRDCGALEKIFQNNCISFEIIGERGLPRAIRKYKKRIGIPIGAALFLIMLLASGRFIWSFEVIGNNAVSDEIILERLDALGCGVGTYIHGVDFDRLYADYLLSYDDTAWISVNVRGTHARVEVLETEIPEKIADDTAPHNMIASEDAVIYSVDIYRGTPVVGVGDLVRKGELIASGMTDIKSGYLLSHASGVVKGCVERSIHIEVPLNTVISRPTGNIYKRKSLNIFGFSLDFFDSTANLSENNDKLRYDTASARRKLTFFGDIEVPINVDETLYTEYAEVSIVFTEAEARSEAYARFGNALREITSEGEIIARDVDASMQGDMFVIDCRLTLICDIAEEQPIYTDKIQEN